MGLLTRIFGSAEDEDDGDEFGPVDTSDPDCWSCEDDGVYSCPDCGGDGGGWDWTCKGCHGHGGVACEDC